MRAHPRSVAIAPLLAALAGCALNPVSRRPELVLVSAGQEKRFGDAEAAKVEREMGLVEDAALAAYVSTIGARLAAHSPRRDVAWRFGVVDVPEPNAFALPGGHVFVTRGLLALLNSEDELAGVIGHEIGHVAARHAVQRVSRGAPFALLTGVTSAVTGLASPLLGALVGGAGALATGLVLAPYSREQEREADRVGQQLAASAGWDPAGISTFLRTLEREERLQHGPRRRPGFLDSHPAMPERVSTTAHHATELVRAPGEALGPSRAALLARLDGLVVGPSAAEGVVEGTRLLHPELELAVQFPDGWRVHNLRQVVAAEAPDGSAVVVLEVAAKGDDPLAAARALEKETGAALVEHARVVSVNGLRAAHVRTQARTREGRIALEIGWIAHRGLVYQLTGLTPPARADAFAPVYDRVLASFAPLAAAERARIREDRLRIVNARRGETLEALARRTRTPWKPEMIAVVNALDPGTALAEGQQLKAAVSEPAFLVPRRGDVP